MNSDPKPPTILADLVEMARQVRRSAKSIRNEWLHNPSTDKKDHAFREVVLPLRDVIESLVNYAMHMEEASITARDLHIEIGDCYGLLGGLYRDWGKYTEAADAYSRGRISEIKVKELGGKSNSYCLVQELVNLILGSVIAFDTNAALIQRLHQAREEVRKQMSEDRAGDLWAQADIALLTQLVSPDCAVYEWDKFEDLIPPRFASEGTKEVLTALLSKLYPYLSPAAKDSWEDAIARLT